MKHGMGVMYKELSKSKGSEHRELFFWHVCRYKLTVTLLVLFADKDQLQLQLHTATPIASTATAATTAATLSRSQRSAPNSDQ